MNEWVLKFRLKTGYERFCNFIIIKCKLDLLVKYMKQGIPM